ncbi:transposable element Tcb1 transposase [Trichonephila clavipes]|nr:transposable element Tcb1 transposase [Trichonephila clavipes]
MDCMPGWVPRVCVSLSVQSRRARLKGCREHGNRTVSDWGNVMFTDESRFALEPDDKRIRIWRKQGTRNQPQKITEHHAFRGRSIMVGAGISLGYRTDLHIFKRGSVTAVWYRDEVLRPIVRLYAAAVGPTFVLMDDITHVPIELTSTMTTWRVKGLCEVNLTVSDATNVFTIGIRSRSLEDLLGKMLEYLTRKERRTSRNPLDDILKWIARWIAGLKLASLKRSLARSLQVTRKDWPSRPATSLVRPFDSIQQERPDIVELKTSVVDTTRMGKGVLSRDELKCTRQSDSR